jgi:heat shock protein HslJ
MTSRWLRLATVLAGSVVLAACGSGASAPSDAVADSELTGRWAGPGRAALDVAPDGSASGNDGCNEVGVATIPSDESSGRFSVDESSEVFCGDVAGWQDADAYEVVGGALVVRDGDGDELTRLTRVG